VTRARPWGIITGAVPPTRGPRSEIVALTLTTDPSPAEREAALALRFRVFVTEQGVPRELERDAHDATAPSVVILDGGEAVATGRLRLVDPDAGVAKVERVAVARDRRGEGLGRRVMAALEARARELGARRVTLGAQESAVPFYEVLGYRVHGEPFLDAGIVHRAMERAL